MTIINSFKTKRFLGRIFFWFTIFAVIIIVILSIVIYSLAQKGFIDKEYETSKKVMTMVKYNILLMDKTIKNLCKYLYINPDVIAIVNDKDNMDINEMITKMNRLTVSVVSSNPFVHSICFYNSDKKDFFYGGKSLYYNDSILENILSKNPDVPKLKPIYRDIENDYGNKKETEKVLTYILYETLRSSGVIDSAVIVNVRTSWLVDNVMQISESDNSKNEGIYIFNEEGQLINNDEYEDTSFYKKIYGEYLIYKNKKDEITGFFENSFDKEKYIISFIHIKEMGITLLKVQQKKALLKYLDTFTESAVLITLIFILFAAVLFFIVSNKLYKPVGNLVKSVAATFGNIGIDSTKDEIAYLGGIYQYSYSKLNGYSTKINEYKDIARSYWLKKLLSYQLPIDQNRFESIAREYEFDIVHDLPIIVCLIRMDNYQELQKLYDTKDKEAVTLTIMNICLQMLKQKYHVECFEMKEDIALIVNITDDEIGLKDFADIMAQIKERVCQHEGRSITVSIGEKALDIGEMGQSYQSAVANSMYRFVLGKGSIITSEKVRNNIINEKIEYPQKMETMLIEYIKTMNVGKIEEVLADIIKKISEYNHNNIVVYITHLVSIINKALYDIPHNIGCQRSLNLTQIVTLETVDELYFEIISFIKYIVDKSGNDGIDSHNKIIVEAAIDIINHKYSDIDLHTDIITSTLGINGRKLARLFKDETGMTISEYITNYRLVKSAELLENKKVSVYEIIKMVGIDNETYFYRLFKNKYGITPKEYVERRRSIL